MLESGARPAPPRDESDEGNSSNRRRRMDETIQEEQVPWMPFLVGFGLACFCEMIEVFR